MRKIIAMVAAILLSSPVLAIPIEGSSKYRTQVQACLKLLSTKAPDDYRFIQGYVGVIAQHDKSGMLAWEEPPRYQMSDVTAFHSLSWCAGTIAHDAYHSYLYKKHSPKNGKPPYDKWAGTSAEQEAIAFQIRVMKKIGASRHEIEYLESLDGTHGDTNSDGKLDSEDYKLRNW